VKRIRGDWRARRMRSSLLFGFAAIVLSSGVANARETAPAIVATVGPGRSIAVQLPGGSVPPRLKAGRYTIVVRDRTRHDNFHLLGTVDRKTGVASVGKERWVVVLRKGLYRYRSDAHPRRLNGSFQVS
jgi:hypothetical protein